MSPHDHPKTWGGGGGGAGRFAGPSRLAIIEIQPDGTEVYLTHEALIHRRLDKIEAKLDAILTILKEQTGPKVIG